MHFCTMMHILPLQWATCMLFKLHGHLQVKRKGVELVFVITAVKHVMLAN